MVEGFTQELLTAFTGSEADDLTTTLRVSTGVKVCSEIVPTPLVLIAGCKQYIYHML